MISTRRSFVKGLAAVVGSIPLPGAVKHLVETLSPTEQTLDDAEDILRGLIARCVNGPIDERDASLIASFLARVPATLQQMNAFNEFQNASLDRRRQLDLFVPYSVRFICTTTKDMRPKEWFNSNFKKLRTVMPHVLETLTDPRFKGSTRRSGR